MPMVPGAAQAASATDAKRSCHGDQGGQIMKKLATLTGVIALAAALGIAVPAKADKEGAENAGTCADLGKIFDAARGHCHTDEPLKLGDLCNIPLTADAKVQKTKETTAGTGPVTGDCPIDLAGFDFAIQRAEIDVTASGDLTIEDTGVGGLVAIIASVLDVAGSLEIGFIVFNADGTVNAGSSDLLGGDVVVARNIPPNVTTDPIAVGTDLTIATTGSVNFRNNTVRGSGDLIISGDAGVSIKDNTILGFSKVIIRSTLGEVFLIGNTFDGAVVEITVAGGDCSSRDNSNIGNPEGNPLSCP